LQRLGQFDAAAAELDTIREALDNAEIGPVEWQQIGMKMQRLIYSGLVGDETQTRHWQAELAPVLETASASDPLSRNEILRNFLFAYATIGLTDGAISLLEQYMTGPHTMTFRFVDAHPAFDGMRDHPEYAELRLKYGDRPAD